MRQVIVLAGYGVSLRARKGMFQIHEKGVKKAEISPVEVEAIVVATRAASITSSAITLAAKHGVDLVFLEGWQPVARLIPATYGSTLKLWIKQLRASKTRRLEYAKAFAYGKIYNQRMVLYSYHKRLKGTKHQTRITRARVREAIDTATLSLKLVEQAETVEQVRSAEAHAAKKYWEAVSKLIPQQLGFKRRIKKYTLPENQEPDPFNKALNIGYAALLRETWRAVFIAGLNPYYGFLHARRPGRMSLVLDLMEEFRPTVVDRPLITLARQKPQTLKKLEQNDKQAVATVWTTVTNTLNKQPKPPKQQILKQARKLAKSITQKQPYTPFKTTW